MTKIKQYTSLAFWISIQHNIAERLKSSITNTIHYYKKLTKHQRLLIASVVSILLIVIITLSTFHTSKKDSSNKSGAISFDTSIPIRHYSKNPKMLLKQTDTFQPKPSPEEPAITNQIKALQSTSDEKINALQSQLQTIQNNLSRLASQGDMQQLQATLSQPNQVVTSKLNYLQRAIQKIADQTAKKTWVDPKKVERYFHLVAIQGFSDGMRAIIDVNSNQTTLSINELCPACRGWILKTMNFEQQSAVFYKKCAHQIFYVQLHAN